MTLIDARMWDDVLLGVRPRTQAAGGGEVSSRTPMRGEQRATNVEKQESELLHLKALVREFLEALDRRDFSSWTVDARKLAAKLREAVRDGS